MRQSDRLCEPALHAVAATTAFAATAFMVWLLMRVPPPLPRATEVELVLIERIAPPAPAGPAPAAPAPGARSAPPPVPAPQRPRRENRDAAPARGLAEPPRTAAAPRPATAPARLYDAQGRIVLAPNPDFDPLRPPRAPGGEGGRAARAANAFERANPLPPQDNRFARDWASDGTLGEALVDDAGKRLQKIVDKLPWRKDIQQARARPPPPVRFNPALHERPSDLGSEATGDAYKAAPIAFEPAPGLDGRASARIRAATGELEQRRGGCDLERLRQWLQPALAGLDELQRIERAYAAGADPVRAEQLLPRSADMAYDRARRAIWYAQRRSADCAAP